MATTPKKQAEAKPEVKSEDTVEKTETKAAPRKRVTAEERIANLEAELKAARVKADEKNAKRVTAISEEKEKLVAKRDDLNQKIAELDTEADRLNAQPKAGDPIAMANDRANAGSTEEE